MTDPNNVTLIEGRVEDLADIHRSMLDDFPPEELKSFDQLAQLMRRGRYKLYKAEHTTLGAILGYAFVFEPESPEIAWLDYIAIHKQYRGAGFGTALLDRLCESYQGKRRGVFIEVERADSEDPTVLATQTRRISFYKRAEAKRLNVEYLFPSPNGPYPMLLLYRPIAKTAIITREQTLEAIDAAFEYIHSDIPDRKAVIATFVGSVRDTAL